MKQYLKLAALFLPCFNCAIAAGTDFCPGSSCTQVWSMSDADNAKPTPYTHGSITCNPTSSVFYDGKIGKLTIKYDHDVGGNSNTCYVMFDFLSKFTPEMMKHGYITATITNTQRDQNSSIKDNSWSAFWLTSRFGTWPTNGEIDMAEYMSSIQGHTTNVNLHGAPDAAQDPKYALSKVVQYNKLGLGDSGKTNVYGMEWQRVNNTYKLTFYFNNVKLTPDVTLAADQYPGKAIVNGLNNRAMPLIFDADHFNAITSTAVKEWPSLHYKMEATDVKAFKVN